MARAPMPQGSGTELLRPVAAPVDTYVAPGPNQLQELAKSLAPLDRELQGFLEERTKRQSEEDAIRGEAAFHSNNAVGFAEGVRKGLIPAQHSRAFMKAYKAAEGAAIGTRLQSEYQAAWDQWGGKNTDDPKAFDQFYEGFIKDRVQTDDPDVLAGLLPAIRTLGNSAAGAQTTYRSNQVYAGSLQAHLAGVNSILDDANDAGLSSGKGTDYTGSAAAIEKQRAAFIASGGKPTDFDEGVINSVTGKAIEQRDPKLLDFFKRNVPGEDYTYGDTPYGSKMKQAAIESLEVIARRSITEGDQAEERARKEQKAVATRSAIDALVSGAEVPEEVLAAGEKADPEFRTRIGQWRDDLSKGLRSPALVRQVIRDVMDGGGVQAVIDAAPSIQSTEDLIQLHTFAKGFDLSKDKIAEVMDSGDAKAILNTIDVRTKGRTDTFDPVAGLSNEGLEAQYDFKMLMQRWIAEHPDATYQETQEAVSKNGKLILDRIQGYDEMMGEGDYQPDDTLKEELPRNPQRDGEKKSAEEPAGSGAPEDLARYYNTFSPEEQAEIAREAAKRGLPLEDALKKLQRVGKKPGGAKAPDGTPIDPTSFQPAERGKPDVPFLSSYAVSGALRPDSFSGMKPAFASGLEAMLKSAPEDIRKDLRIMSGYRSTEKQGMLWAGALKKYGSPAAARKMVAPPGKSGHNHGHAADLKFRSDAAREWVHQNAAKFGLTFPMSWEPWHIELSGARDGRAPAKKKSQEVYAALGFGT